MNAVVAYHSRNGHTQRAADAIVAELAKRGAEANSIPIERLTGGAVEAADIVFLGTWAQGLFVVAVRPAGMTRWLPALPSLAGKPTAAFATYRFRPAGLLQTFGDAVRSKGGRLVASHAFQRDRLDGNVGRFVDQALAGRAA